MSCPDCIKGVVLPGEPTGTMQSDGSYLAPGPGTTDKAVVYLTDVFGLSMKNSKIMADEFAKQLGCDVWVPDMFAGKPPIGVEQLDVPDRPGVKKTFWSQIKFLITIISCLPRFIRSRPSVVQARIETFLTKIRKEKGYTKIGAVGYCYGGLTCVRVGAQPGFLDAIVVCHPGPFSLDLLKTIVIPSSWACAEEDDPFPDKKRLQAEAILAGRKDTPTSVNYEFKYYKGTAHGFATRPNLTIPEVKEGYEGAFNQTVEWFNKWLV